MLQILSVILVLMLEFNVQHINGIPHPPMNSLCNCIPVKNCVPYKSKLQNSRNDELLEAIEILRMAGCGIDAFGEPMICCPTKTESFDFTNHHLNSMRDRWVWTSRPQKNDKKSYGADISTNLINDYVDWKTERNCPPILYKETKYHFHKKFREHHLPTDDHVHGHDCFQYHTLHNFDSEEDDDCNEHAILHSGSKHTFRPADLPKTHETRTRGRPETTPSTSTTTTTTTQRAPVTPATLNTPNCGVTLNKRIIGGIEALPGEFPWITRIAYLNSTDNSIAYRCTGSFITELHILTAAHCVTNLDDSLSLSHVRLVDTDANNDCNNQNEPCQETPNNFQIVETIVHPNYDNPRRSNDIAILKIQKPTDIELNYGTVCLPSSNLTNNNLIGSTAIVAGWSNNDENTETNDLQVRYLRLRILNNTDCADSYNTFRQGFTEKISIISSMVCTQGQSNVSDVCRGDSGGPLMDDGNSGIFNREGRYTLLGIVAFGPICGFTNLLPGVYMRVSEFVDWIASNIK